MAWKRSISSWQRYQNSHLRFLDGEPFQAFTPVYPALLNYLFQPQDICWFLFWSYSSSTHACTFFYADVSWLFTYKPLMKCQDWPAAFGLTATQPWSRQKKALMAQKVGVLHMKRGEILAASWSGKKRKRQYQHKDLHCPKRKICLLLFWWSSWRWSLWAAQHRQQRRTDVRKAVLTWHKIRYMNGCKVENLKQHWALSSSSLLHAVGSFFVYL